MRRAVWMVAVAVGLVATAPPAGAWTVERRTDRITGETRSAHAIRQADDGAELLVVECARLADVVVWRVHVQLGPSEGRIGAPMATVPVRWRVDPGGRTGGAAWEVSFDPVYATLSDAVPAVRREALPAAALVGLMARGRTVVVEVPRAGRGPLQRAWDLRGLTAQLRSLRDVGCEIPAP